MRPFICNYDGDHWRVVEGPRRLLLDDERFQSYLTEYKIYSMNDRMLMARDAKGFRNKLQWLRDNVWDKKFRWDSTQQRIVEIE